MAAPEGGEKRRGLNAFELLGAAINLGSLFDTRCGTGAPLCWRSGSRLFLARHPAKICLLPPPS